MSTDFCRRAKVELKREPYLSFFAHCLLSEELRRPTAGGLKYGRLAACGELSRTMTEEDDSQDIAPYGINPEEQCTEEESLTYGVYTEYDRSDEDAFLQYPEY